MTVFNLKLTVVTLFILIVTIIFISCNNRQRNTSTTFVDFLTSGNISNLWLTIYHSPSFSLTREPISVEHLTGGWYDFRIAVSGNVLSNYIDLFQKFSTLELTPLEGENYINARLHYVFHTKEHGELLNVTVGGKHFLDIFVNDIAIEWNPFFLEIIMPFVPSRVADDWNWWIENPR